MDRNERHCDGVPGAAQFGNGTNYVFARGTDGSLQVDHEPGGSSTWSGFPSLGARSPDQPHLMGADEDGPGHLVPGPVHRWAGCGDRRSGRF